jgi:dolichol-phosphate mannosyltransferase
MDMVQKTVVLIPTYNEGESIQELLRRLLQLYPGMDILVIDDNSPDGTGNLIEEFRKRHARVHILHRKAKLGLAHAYQEGFSWVLQREYDYVVLMDGDLSHQPCHISEMLRKVQNGVDVVIGSRYVKGGSAEGWAVWRFLISRMGNIYSRLILGLEIQDLTSGFKCMKTEALKAIDFFAMRSNGYVFQIELAFLLLNNGFRVEEYPIKFLGRVKGRSKLSLGLFLEALCMVLRLKFNAKK